jgi:hypothetical protein
MAEYPILYPFGHVVPKVVPNTHSNTQSSPTTMINVNFYLRDFKTKTGNQVYAKLYDSNFPTANIRIGTKTRVYPNCWNQEDQIALTNKVYTKDEVGRINSQLSEVKNSIQRIIDTLDLRGQIVTAPKVKELYETGLEGLRKEVHKENRVNELIIDYFAPYAAKKHFRSPARMAYKSYLKFESATGKRKIKEINYELMKDFAEWMGGNENGDSTIYQRLKAFRTFVKKELLYKMKIDETYKEYEVSFESSEIFRLTLEQFNALFTMKNLPEHLQKTLDMFMLMITIGGIRISSALKLTDDSFDKAGKKVTYLEMKKEAGKPTLKQITNPLNEFAIDVLERNGWRMPCAIQSQHFNPQLRQIISLSPLKDDYFIIDEHKEKNVRKYISAEITSKVARKTFVSMNEDFGITRTVSNLMSNHSNKEGNASDAYRLGSTKARWEAKLEAMEKWNIEYYKLFPKKASKATGSKVFKLADGKKLVIINNQLVGIE